MDPRRVELNRRHSREMEALLDQFTDVHPDIEPEVKGVQMTPEQDAAWSAFSAKLLSRHRAERSELADVIEVEQRNPAG